MDAIGTLRAAGDTDPGVRRDVNEDQMLFEIHGLILALHHDARFLRLDGVTERARLAFERIVQHYAAPARRARR